MRLPLKLVARRSRRFRRFYQLLIIIAFAFAAPNAGAALAACLFNGQTIAHDQKVAGYRVRTAPSGLRCRAERRTCNNGVLSGSSPYSSCVASNTIAGFAVVISGAALKSPSLSSAVDRLQTRLEEVRSLSASVSKLAGQLTFFLTDSRWETAAMTYHPSADWLSRNKMNVAMAKNIEIINLNSFLAWNVATDQPMMVLHEISHAYNDKIIDWEQPALLNAYNAAKASGIYNRVRYQTLNGILLPAYAMTNAHEYFAELSEAYYGTNSYYPFNRSQLQTFDPTGFALMQTAWGP